LYSISDISLVTMALNSISDVSWVNNYYYYYYYCIYRAQRNKYQASKASQVRYQLHE
jgi:hypothetical protein